MSISSVAHLSGGLPAKQDTPSSGRWRRQIEEDEGSTESYQQYLQRVLSYLASLKPTPGETEAEIVVQETSELENLKMQYQKLQ